MLINLKEYKICARRNNIVYNLDLSLNISEKCLQMLTTLACAHNSWIVRFPKPARNTKIKKIHNTEDRTNNKCFLRLILKSDCLNGKISKIEQKTF